MTNPSLERVLILHNRYARHGGEDVVAEAEACMLSSRGHEVRTLVSSNEGLPEAGLGKKASVGLRTIWDERAYREVRRTIRECRPEIVHCHNTFPTPSPSVYYAAHAERVPVVQTLHNYRAFCVNGLLFRDGRMCSDCLGRGPWRGVLHRCYRESTTASGAVAAMIAWHRTANTWQTRVDRYIALTEESRRMMVLAGLPAGRIRVKPNFVSPDPGHGSHAGGYVLFVGRLSQDKGVNTLVAAWSAHGASVPIRIVGDGPLRTRVLELAAGNPLVTYLGRLPGDQVRSQLRDAALLVIPSISPEGMPLVILEAFATGLPVLASDHPNLVEIVGEAGWFFATGDPAALSARVRETWDRIVAKELSGAAARAAYEDRYTEDRNYGQLRQVYQEAMQSRRDVG